MVSIIAMVGFLNMIVALKQKWPQVFGRYFDSVKTVYDTLMTTLSIMVNQGRFLKIHLNNN